MTPNPGYCWICEQDETPERPVRQEESHLYWTGDSDWAHDDCWIGLAERFAEDKAEERFRS